MSADIESLEATRVKLERAAAVTVQLRAGELASAVAAAEAGLIAAGAGIYQRGGQLVRVAQLESQQVAAGIKRAAGTPVILPVTRDYLRLALATHLNFVSWDGRARKLKPVDPPSALCSLLIAAAGQWHFPELRGIVSAPTLRPDGSLLAAAGYDAQSRLIFWNDGTAWPAIPEQPTREDAAGALSTLRDLLAEFDFADEASASAAIAAILTACLRHALPIAPGYGLNAHKQGSGKTTLGHTIARIPTGRDAAVMPLADEPGEVRKAVLAVLMAADLIVLIDNISAPVDSSAVCAALTSQTYKDRVLGESRTVTLPTAATWLFNGNNLEFVGDFTSRIIVSTLDPQCERPELRAFRRDIAAHVSEHRPELVRAALTIPLAYRAAGHPAIEATPSRFSDWDRLVRYPLVWLGCADPLATQEELRTNDPIRSSLIAVMSAWHECFADRPATVAEAIERAADNAKLLAALSDVAGEPKGTINTRRLGRWLVKHLRRIEDGKRFEDAGRDPITCRRRFQLSSVTSVSSVAANARARVACNTTRMAGKNADNEGNDVERCPRCDGEGCEWCEQSPA